MNPTEPTPSRRPLRDWYEQRSPAVRALIVVAVTTALNQFAPWLTPLFRATTGEPPAVVQPK